MFKVVVVFRVCWDSWWSCRGFSGQYYCAGLVFPCHV